MVLAEKPTAPGITHQVSRSYEYVHAVLVRAVPVFVEVGGIFKDQLVGDDPLPEYFLFRIEVGNQMTESTCALNQAGLDQPPLVPGNDMGDDIKFPVTVQCVGSAVQAEVDAEIEGQGIHFPLFFYQFGGGNPAQAAQKFLGID